MWGCFLAIFDYKTGDFLRFLTKICPPTDITAIFPFWPNEICLVELGQWLSDSFKPLFCGKTTTRLIWCGKNCTVRQQIVARQFFLYFRGSGKSGPPMSRDPSPFSHHGILRIAQETDLTRKGKIEMDKWVCSSQTRRDGRQSVRLSLADPPIEVLAFVDFFLAFYPLFLSRSRKNYQCST